MGETDKKPAERLVQFLNTRCKARYWADSESVRFIACDGAASIQFLEMSRIAADLGILPSGRDMTFIGEDKLRKLEVLGVTIDRSEKGQKVVISNPWFQAASRNFAAHSANATH